MFIYEKWALVLKIKAGISFFVVIACLYVWFNIIKKIKLNKVFWYSIIISAFVFLFVMQILFVITIYQHIEYLYDVEGIRNLVIKTPDFLILYISNYYNNAFLYALSKFFYEITGKHNYWLTLSIFNTIFVDIAIIFTCLISKELYGKRVAFLTFVFCMLMFGFSFYLAYPYTDTFSMPFNIIAFYFLLRTIKAQTKNKCLIFSAFTGVFFALGYLMKPIIFAAVFALFVVLVVTLWKSLKYKTGGGGGTLFINLLLNYRDILFFVRLRRFFCVYAKIANNLLRQNHKAADVLYNRPRYHKALWRFQSRCK
jgi:asparagine N-glycosylation enzyme membrane subunit Stt3